MSVKFPLAAGLTVLLFSSAAAAEVARVLPVETPQVAVVQDHPKETPGLHYSYRDVTPDAEDKESEDSSFSEEGSRSSSPEDARTMYYNQNR